jgi:large subunit ribosomal protein L10
MRKADKISFVNTLTQELQTTKSVVLVDYTGITVKAQQDLKKRLKDIQSKMLVVKNTLLKRAGEAAKIDKKVLDDSVLAGQTAVITAEGDPIQPLQVLYKFAKEFETPSFKAGVIDGNFYNKEMLIKIAQLPSKEILLGQTVSSIASPIYGIVNILQGNLQKLLYILKSKSQN